MTTTALIDSGDRQAGLPPLLSLVPVGGPDVFVYSAIAIVLLLLLLVPPFTVLATLVAVALVVAAVVAGLVALAAAVLRAPFLLVRRLRRHALRSFSLPVAPVRKVKVRRA